MDADIMSRFTHCVIAFNCMPLNLQIATTKSNSFIHFSANRMFFRKNCWKLPFLFFNERMIFVRPFVLNKPPVSWNFGTWGIIKRADSVSNSQPWVWSLHSQELSPLSSVWGATAAATATAVRVRSNATGLNAESVAFVIAKAVVVGPDPRSDQRKTKPEPERREWVPLKVFIIDNQSYFMNYNQTIKF